MSNDEYLGATGLPVLFHTPDGNYRMIAAFVNDQQEPADPPTPAQLKLRALPVNTHFWATTSLGILVVLKDVNGDFYYCGGWEGSVPDSEFEFLQEIAIPQGYTEACLYY